MADLKLTYGSLVDITPSGFQSLTHSLTVGQQTVKVDNSTDRYLDALVFVTVDMPGSGTVAVEYGVSVYAAGSIDGGTDFTDGASGSAGSFTMASSGVLSNLRKLGMVLCDANSVVERGGPFSVAAAFGGVLPPFWSIIVRNGTNLTLDSSGNLIEYVPVRLTTA